MQNCNPESKNSSTKLFFTITGDTENEIRQNYRNLQITLESFPDYAGAARTKAAEGLLRPGETEEIESQRLKTSYERSKEFFQSYTKGSFKIPEYIIVPPKVWENQIRAFQAQGEEKSTAPSSSSAAQNQGEERAIGQRHI